MSHLIAGHASVSHLYCSEGWVSNSSVAGEVGADLPAVRGWLVTVGDAVAVDCLRNAVAVGCLRDAVAVDCLRVAVDSLRDAVTRCSHVCCSILMTLINH